MNKIKVVSLQARTISVPLLFSMIGTETCGKMAENLHTPPLLDING